MRRALIISAMLAFCVIGRAMAVTEENADDFMQLHQIEIVFHQAGTTKNLDLMLSLSQMTRQSPQEERPIPARSRSEAIGRRPGHSSRRTSGSATPPRFSINNTFKATA